MRFVHAAARALVQRPKRTAWAVAVALVGAAGVAGFASLETQQRKWIFQASQAPVESVDALARRAADDGMESVFIEHTSPSSGRVIRLHGLWAANDDPHAPVLLFLHGARRDVGRNTFRVEQMRELGFAVLAVDYRGFGNSTDELPSETGVVEDAAAAWRWLGQHRAGRPRYLYGHSLGGAIAVQLAARLAEGPLADEPKGVIVEGTFTSINDMFHTFKWGWLPVSMLITERFDSLAAVARIRAPLLVVHGSADSLVPSRFGLSLFEKAKARKRFLLIEGGTHSSTSWRGAEQYQAALHEFFGLPVAAGAAPTAG